MKKNLSRNRLARLNSFTLVELLVVIGIIAILASILIVAASSAINAAKRARAATIGEPDPDCGPQLLYGI